MPLERFIPKSPDPNIRNSQDFEVAKFGHLNTIIEYINTYVAADGLQLSGTGPLSTTLRAITDNIGNTSKLLLSTTSTAVSNDFRFLGAISGYVAIEAPNSVTTYTLKLPSTTGSAGQAIITDGSGNLSFGTVTTSPSGVAGAIQFSNGSAFASDAANLFWDNTNKRLGIGTNAPTNTLQVNGSTKLGQLTFTNQTIANTVATAITVNSTSAIDLTSSLGARFYAGYLNGAFLATTSGFFVGNEVPGSISARLQVKGSGSTSATTSLLVQNSAGTQYFKVQDDGVVLVATNTALRTGIASSTYYLDLGEVIVRNGNGTAGASMTIGKSSPAVSSSILELSSTTKGFLPPRMTNSERGLITTPAIGLMVYCTDAVEGLYIYKSTGWTFVI